MLCLERRDPEQRDGGEREGAPALATLRAVESVQLPSLRGAAAVDELLALFERTFASARVRPSDVWLASAANGTAADHLEAAALARLAASVAGAPRGVSRRVRALWFGFATWIVRPWWKLTSPGWTGENSGAIPRASGPCSRSKPRSVKMFANAFTPKR